MSPSPFSQPQWVEVSHHLVLSGKIMTVRLHHVLCTIMMTMTMTMRMMRMMMMMTVTVTVIKMVSGLHQSVQHQTPATLLLNEVCVFLGVWCVCLCQRSKGFGEKTKSIFSVEATGSYVPITTVHLFYNFPSTLSVVALKTILCTAWRYQNLFGEYNCNLSLITHAV